MELTGKGLIKAAVWHEPVGSFVHAPIFVTINTSKVLGLKEGAVASKLDVNFEQGMLGGKEGDPKIKYYKSQGESGHRKDYGEGERGQN